MLSPGSYESTVSPILQHLASKFKDQSSSPQPLQVVAGAHAEGLLETILVCIHYKMVRGPAASSAAPLVEVAAAEPGSMGCVIERVELAVVLKPDE